MAIEKYSPNDLLDLNEDWGQDANDPLLRPYSGRAVQKFIKDQLKGLHEEKFGNVTYDAGVLNFYDKDEGTVIMSLALTGTIYSIGLQTETPPTFTVLRDSTSNVISITPSSKEGSIGGEMSDFLEGYTWVMAVDKGSGFVTVGNGSCEAGKSFSADIRPYVEIGINRVRFSVTGVESLQTKSIIFTATVTSLTFECKHDWQTAWIEGSTYYINNITFSGNMVKTLNIRIDEDDSKLYTQQFAVGSNYTTTPYKFEISDYFPGSTGNHIIEAWVSASGVVSERYKFNVMCVAAADEYTAELICLNNVLTTALNYENQALFDYAVYGVNEATFNIVANDSTNQYTVVDNMSISVVSNRKETYSLQLEIPTEENTGVSLSIEAIAGSSTVSKVVNVDNTNSFSAISGAHFYMNASLRQNGSAGRENFNNDVPSPLTATYPATWSDFSWTKDGWYQDIFGVKGLVVQAGSTVRVGDLKPLTALREGKSLTLEFKIRVDNVANYDLPIMSMMSDEIYDPNTTSGIILFPTKITILNDLNRNIIQQSVNFQEAKELHFVVVFQRGYSSTERNLCTVYVNGVPQCVFEYRGDANFGNGSLRLGQVSSDLTLYMLRYYNDIVLESDGVLRNWLNVFTDNLTSSREGIRDENRLFDGSTLSYSAVKGLGLNTMVIEMENDARIPSFDNPASGVKSTLTVEYGANPHWNFKITNAPIDGQGTTSMRYARWNLRWKLLKADPAKGVLASVWNYHDDTTSSTKGWFDGAGNHIKVGRITAKKNIASSSHGHKMGATAMYNDLYMALGLGADLPNQARVAVFQYPVVGFQKYSDGTYSFIGMYTIGPDKGDKDTFGYSTSTFPDLLSIEGPNHAPLGTRFLHPWINVTYNSDDETLKFGGEEGWDLSAYNDSKYANDAQILSLYESEWKPAYELVYNCSPHLRSLAEVGLTLSQINADVNTFRNSTGILGNRKNDLLSIYDSNYNLIYYSNYTKNYVVSSHNVRDYVSDYLTTPRTDNGVVAVDPQNPTTAELISARKDKFAFEAENYFDVPSLLFHEDFLFLIGGSDNHAKNFYPFKLKSLAEGGRWSFRQDDLDTIMATDNNGNLTKPYFVEPGDLNVNGVDVYQGASSVLWTLVRDVFKARLRAMMADIVDEMLNIALDNGLTKNYTWETLLSVFDFYFWRRSAKYFPVRLYSEDSVFSYISIWAADPSKTYNGVPPLTQALGTQLEAEQQWALRRILYTLSKYEIGGFTGSESDGLNSLEFTPAAAYTFKIKPAIALYPSGNLGGGSNTVAGRTYAGEEAQININSSDGSTTYYLKSIDWLSDLGDLSTLRLTSRGGGVNIAFNVASKRLKSLKIGDENPASVLFNPTSFSVSSDSLESIDARNITTITSAVDLGNCPRLRTVMFEGSSVPSVTLPLGSKIQNISYPSMVRSIYLNELPFLTNANINIPATAMAGIRSLYIAQCPNINMFDLLRDISETEGSDLHFFTILMGTVQGRSTDLALLTRFIQPYSASPNEVGFGTVTYSQANKTYSTDGNVKPNLQGVINIPSAAYKSDVDALENYFQALTVNVTDFYVEFEDAEIKSVLAVNFGDGIGVLNDEVYPLTGFSGIFSQNTNIQKFNELSDFISIVSLEEGTFDGCSNFSEFEYPNNGSALLLVNNNIFRETAISSIIIPPGTTHIGNDVFYGCSNVSGTVVIPDSVVSIGEFSFASLDNPLLTSLTIGSGITVIKESAFEGSLFSSLDEIPSGVTTIEAYAFYDFGAVNGCGPLLIEGGSLYSIGDRAFSNSKFTGKVTIPSSVQVLSDRSLSSMNFVTEFDIKGNIAQIGIPGSGAIRSCPLLTKITYPASVTVINQSEASNCVSLSEVIMQPATPPTLSSGFLNGSDNAIVRVSLESSGLYHTASGWSAIKSRIFPYEGTYLLIEDPAVLAKLRANQQLNPNGYAFIDRDRVTFLTSIEEMFMGDTSVIQFDELTEFTNITNNDFAFKNCTNLQSVPFSNLSVIGESMFDGCSSLTGDLNLSNATIIGPNAFRGCWSLSGTLSLSSNLTSIGAGALPIASSLTDLALGVDYDLDVYNDFSMTAWSAASLNQSISNCKAGTSASRKRMVLSSSSYAELNTSYPSAIANAANRFIDVVKEGFIPLIAPASFESPADFATYGEDMDIVKAFNEYPSEHKKYAYTVSVNTTDTLVLPVVAGRTYAYKENGMPSYTVTSGGNLSWTWGMGNRHVIVLNTGPTETIQYIGDTPFASWIYVGPNTLLKAISEGGGYHMFNDRCKYIHVYSKNCVSLITRAMYQGFNLTGQVNVSMLNAIPDYSFQGCAQLSGVLNITSNITTIGMWGFQNSTGITGLVMSDSVTTMLQNAFKGCTGLTSISLSNSLTRLGEYTFSGCTGITGQVVLPNSITEIALEAFSFCPNITSIVLPSNLQRVKNSVFRQSPGLTGNLTFPATIIEIGGWSFQECTGLASVTCLATTPPSLGSGAFPNTVPIYVPSASVNAYKIASGWSAYASKIYAI